MGVWYGGVEGGDARLGCGVCSGTVHPLVGSRGGTLSYLDVCKRSNTNTGIAEFSDEELVDDDPRVDTPLTEFGVALTGIGGLEHCVWRWGGGFFVRCHDDGRRGLGLFGENSAELNVGNGD